MKEISIVGLDLGAVVLRRKLSRGQVLAFFTDLPKCIVAMEACATAHYWAREIGRLGHEVRLLPPAYVSPSSNDRRMMRLTPRPSSRRPSARRCGS